MCLLFFPLVAGKVVGSTRDKMPTDTATAGGEKNDADNPDVSGW